MLLLDISHTPCVTKAVTLQQVAAHQKIDTGNGKFS